MAQSDDTAGPGTTSRKTPLRAARVRAACLRCQQRKMRCDGMLPSCKPCQQAGVVCTRHRDPDGSRESRTHIAQLQNRIARLESTVQNRCPDVSLGDMSPVGQPDSQPEPQSEPEVEVPPHHQPSTGFRPRFQPERQPQPPYLSLDPSHRVEGSGDRSTQHPPRPIEQRLSTSPGTPRTDFDHELGLVSASAGADHRYIGASSGYFFARYILSTVGGSNASAGAGKNTTAPRSNSTPTSHLNVLQIPPAPLPKTWKHAEQLSSTYFETVHLQFPFLHYPSYEDNLRRLYAREDSANIHSKTENDPIVLFQTYMVLAIASTILSRRIKVTLPSEGFSVSALEHLQNVNLTGSIKGLQCTLLLLVYALNSPSLGLNMWYLHHQCVATLIDLGFQCLPSESGAIVDEQLKRRAFMCTYTIDQALATIMGRPCALKDEDCSTPPPQVVSGDTAMGTRTRESTGSLPTDLSNAVHLFQLARMNSEIMYFLHPGPLNSFSTYKQRAQVDLAEWQQNMLSRLAQWAASIPVRAQDGAYISGLSEIKYHNAVMLLLRPSPAIRTPSEEALKRCYESAVQTLRIYNRLYKKNVLAYSWVTVHAVFLSCLTMLYCVWTIPDSAMKIRIDVLVSDLKAGSDVLSATGEHWPQAKQCRDALENLSNSTIRWLFEKRERQSEVSRCAYNNEHRRGDERTLLGPGVPPSSVPAADWTAFGAEGGFLNENSTSMEPGASALDPTEYLDLDIINSVFGGPHADMQGQGYGANSVFQGIFSDYQPTLDFLR